MNNRTCVLALWAVLLAGGAAQAQYLGPGRGLYGGQNAGRYGSARGLFPGMTNMVTPATFSGYVPDDKIKLRIGDKVSIQIREDRDLPLNRVVTDSGELDMPYIGRVPVVEKTCKQVVAEVKVLLEKEYYHRATVMLALDEANKLWGRVYVFGQVKNQGALEVQTHENITVSTAILRAGGFGDFAKKTKVMIVRRGPNGVQKIEVNMEQVIEKGQIDKDVPLQPEDKVVVPSRAFGA